jgi:hypothetical protein
MNHLGGHPKGQQEQKVMTTTPTTPGEGKNSMVISWNI